MKDNATVPSLSVDGWVNTPLKAADYLFSHLFLSDFSQTYIYDKSISSVPYLLFEHQNSISTLVSAMRSTIELYFGQYFEQVNVDVVNTSGGSSSGSITIYLELVQDGEIITLNKLLEYTDSKIKKIVDYNNNGG